MISVPEYEQGVTRVFALSMTDTEAQALQNDTKRQCEALGVSSLNAAGIDVFKISDLGDIGLVGYLREGVDAQTGDINRDSVKLAALDGWVMTVHSTAFEGAAATLNPDAKVALVGTYAQEQPEAPEPRLESDAAQAYTGTPTPGTQPKPGNSSSGSLVVVGLLLLGALLLWWALA